MLQDFFTYVAQYLPAIAVIGTFSLLLVFGVYKLCTTIDQETYIPLDSEAVKKRCPNAWTIPLDPKHISTLTLEPGETFALSSDGIQWTESRGMETPLPATTLKVKNDAPLYRGDCYQEEEKPVARKSALERLNDWREKNPNPHTLTERVRIRLLGMNAGDRQKRRKWEAKNLELSCAHTADYAERYERVNTQILQSRNRIDGLRGSIDELREIVIQCNKGGK